MTGRCTRLPTRDVLLVEVAAVGSGVGGLVPLGRHRGHGAEVRVERDRDPPAEPRATVADRADEGLRLSVLLPEHAEVPQDRRDAVPVGGDLQEVDRHRVPGLGAADAHGPRDGGEGMAVTRGRERRRHVADVPHVGERAADDERHLLARVDRHGRGRVGVDREEVPGRRLRRAAGHRESLPVARRRPKTAGLTTRSGHSPRSTAAACRLATRAESAADSVDSPAAWGVATTFSKPQQGIRRVGRLLLEHVQAGAGDPAGLEGPREGGLVDDAAAAAVDEVRGALHRPELALAQEVPGLGIEGDLDGDPVRLAEERVEVADHAYAELPRHVLLDVGVVGDRPEPERLEAPRQRLPDRAQAHEAGRLAVERCDRAAGGTVPHASPHRPVVLAELPVEREEQRRRVVGDLDVADVRRVRDEDARPRGGLDVDPLEAVAEAADRPRPVHRGDRRGVDLEPADHDDVGAADRSEHVVLRPALGRHDLDVEPVEGGRPDLVREHLGRGMDEDDAGLRHGVRSFRISRRWSKRSGRWRPPRRWRPGARRRPPPRSARP